MPRSLLCLALLLVVSPAAASAQPRTHRYTPTAGVPTFAARPPVLRIAPGDTVETETYSHPDDYYARAGGSWPGEVGPFHIEGVGPGDTLVVKVVKLQLNRDQAVSAVNPSGISAVAADSRTRMLNDPLPPRRYEWRLDRARSVGVLDLPASASRRIEIPLRPMLGRVAVAPFGEESWGGLWPGNFGDKVGGAPVAIDSETGKVASARRDVKLRDRACSGDGTAVGEFESGGAAVAGAAPDRARGHVR